MPHTFDPAALTLPCAHHIGGALVPDAPVIEVFAPSDGRRLGAIPCADAAMVDRAVQAARAAQAASGWATRPPRDRVRALYAWADAVMAAAPTLAQVEAVCSSRPYAQALAGDIRASADQIRFFAEFADKEGGDLVPTADASFGYIADEPYGVVGAIVPWNFPISMAVWKLAPALAAGNAVVLKPSEMTPWSALMLADLAVQAGLPPGLVTIVQGDGPRTGAALAAHPGIGKLSFTGSTRAGAEIMRTIAGAGIKPMTLELGGKSPMVVLADADPDLTVECLARGILPNAGQFCVAGSRLIVHESLSGVLTARLTARFAAQAPAPTWAAKPGFCPIISDRQLARIDAIVQDARRAGADLICGGARFDCPGSYYRPTLLGGVGADNPAVAQEIFGPVATIQTFATEDEAMALAAHDYGLCAGLFTRDLSAALRLTRRFQAGTIWVNRYGRSDDHILPTGGWGASGFGKDLGRDAYRANRRMKSVLIGL